MKCMYIHQCSRSQRDHNVQTFYMTSLLSGPHFQTVSEQLYLTRFNTRGTSISCLNMYRARHVSAGKCRSKRTFSTMRILKSWQVCKHAMQSIANTFLKDKLNENNSRDSYCTIINYFTVCKLLTHNYWKIACFYRKAASSAFRIRIRLNSLYCNRVIHMFPLKVGSWPHVYHRIATPLAIHVITTKSPHVLYYHYALIMIILERIVIESMSVQTLL